MHLRTSNRHLPDSFAHAGHQMTSFVRERPRSIGGIVLIGLLVAFGIWVWPELHRTIRMHRM